MTETNKPAPAKRSYKTVAVEPRAEGFALLLDGRPAKTPTGARLAAPSSALVEAIAEEWRAAEGAIEFESKPLTRLLVAAVEHGDAARGRWTNDIVNFLRSDLLCYRAAEPGALRARQAAIWDPYLDWARAAMEITLKTATGVIAFGQPEESIRMARKALEAAAPAAVLGVKAASELTGSAVLALALWKRAFPVEAVFAASRIDEMFQAERWGFDAEAQVREKRIRADFMNAARYLALLED